jgi:ABC-type enterobactin transport system permease subunit
MDNPVSPKVTAGAATGAAVTLIIFGIQQAGYDVPVLVAGFIPVGIGAVAAWWKKDPLRRVLGGGGKRVAEHAE